MKEVKAPLEQAKSKELTKAENNGKKIGKFVVTSTLLLGAVLVARKIMNAVNNRKNKFKVYKVAKT